LEKTGKDWWKGELNGLIGFFPSEYVIEIPRKSTNRNQVFFFSFLFFPSFFLSFFGFELAINCSSKQQNVTTDIEIEGFLNKKGEKMMVKNWQKRWCYVKEGKFHICPNKV